MTDTTTKAAPAKSATRAAKADQRKDEPAPEKTATGADRPVEPSTGKDRPDDFGANAETYESATYQQTHGANPQDDVHDLADF